MKELTENERWLLSFYRVSEISGELVQVVTHAVARRRTGRAGTARFVCLLSP